LLAALFFASTPAASQPSAQPWPQRPVKFIVTLGPASGVDIGARLIGDRLSRRWHQPVVVENRPGGDGLLALGAFAAANDDHVLLAAPSGTFTAHPFLYKSLPYKPSDLVPVVRISNTVLVLAVTASLDVKSMDDLVALTRSHPGKINWSGTTGAQEFLFGGFLKRADLAMAKVPYRNQVEAANDLAAGRIDVDVTALAVVRPQLQAGTVRLIAVSNSERASIIPDVPTVTEQGYPDLAQDGLVGLFAPPSMAAATREAIAADVGAIIADPLIEERLNLTGQVVNFGGPAEFAAAVERQRAHIAAAAKALGVEPVQ
jgi:tripartite-type tricarboxylate transporter receptor subunit TctC